ncbi:sugar phosphate isomerase/epimerase [Ammoniphilus sp. CFH 90114]|uniref:sugar phosphate isomerase/epimerase family protein n=1 Tax=Ammoniphilus sp. CFH 90114 TaxID=2493665 RepID=UPI00100E89A7|nr:sugar phosphate isomerase/epimerase [Ammoniphilus sp. CFH 90114]RXT03745.1 sugar phosphate isomerase/epimerase [Ammoniphilus sp. CFH 90114]
MRIGLYHSCFRDWELEKTFAWAKEHGFYGIELHGGPRYKHINWKELAEGKNTTSIMKLQESYDMPIIGIMFGAIPFLSPDESKRAEAVEYIDMLLRAASNMGVKVVSTFTGRDPLKTIEENLDMYEQVFPAIAEKAEKYGVSLAFENCPMYEFWPPVYNIAVSPYLWKELFTRVPSNALGLNIDPSHLVWQGIDYVEAVHDFKDRIVLAQAKDTEVLLNVLRKEGMLTMKWWRHRIPGQGDVDWNKFITALHEIGYDHVLSIEHEDPIWEGTEELVQKGLLHAKRHLEQFI